MSIVKKNRQIHQLIEQVVFHERTVRSELVHALGLTLPTIAAMTDEVVCRNIFIEVGDVSRGLRGGRPPNKLEINKNLGYILIANFLPAMLVCSVVNLQGEILECVMKDIDEIAQKDLYRFMADAAKGILKRGYDGKVLGVLIQSSDDIYIKHQLVREGGAWLNFSPEQTLSLELAMPPEYAMTCCKHVKRSNNDGFNIGSGGHVYLHIGDNEIDGIIVGVDESQNEMYDIGNIIINDSNDRLQDWLTKTALAKRISGFENIDVISLINNNDEHANDIWCRALEYLHRSLWNCSVISDVKIFFIDGYLKNIQNSEEIIADVQRKTNSDINITIGKPHKKFQAFDPKIVKDLVVNILFQTYLSGG